MIMRNRFDAQLSTLHTEIVAMGAMTEAAIAGAVKGLLERDNVLAQTVANGDNVIDNKEREIEALCLKLLLRQQPVASDLRLISSAMKMITDIERIGDQAADIAELTSGLIERGYHGEYPLLADMARETIRMVTEAIDAFVKKDLALARTVVQSDDVVDDMFDHIRMELTDSIRRDTAESTHAIDLIMIAKYFERIGDHATNIAEWVCFSITGVPEQ